MNDIDDDDVTVVNNLQVTDMVIGTEHDCNMGNVRASLSSASVAAAAAGSVGIAPGGATV